MTYPCLGCSDLTHCEGCANGFILSEDNTTCIQPLENCEDSRDQYIIDQSTGMFKCSLCNDGFIWSRDDWACMPCELIIPDCTNCTGGKCHECNGENQFPTYLRDACMVPFTNCSDLFVPADYQIVNGEYMCNTCDDGFYWSFEENNCRECEWDIDECSACTQDPLSLALTCTECEGGLMP